MAIALLLAQVASIAYHRRVPEKYFCWAPYDQQTRFTVKTVVGGRVLGPGEVATRYRFHDYMWDGRAYWDQRAYGNVLGWIRRYEEGPGRADAARVEVTYSVNGRPPEVWTWPR